MKALPTLADTVAEQELAEAAEAIVPGASRAAGAADVSLVRISASHCAEVTDALAIEEPMEIRLSYHSEGQRRSKTVSITMRTPGHDLELAIGFLFNEAILSHPSDIRSAAHRGSNSGCRARNVVQVELHDHVAVNLASLVRSSYTTSSCGVCGKTSIEAFAPADVPPLQAGVPCLNADLIYRLPELLREAQAVFASTGGLHASGLFDTSGQLQCLREDIGRHNALDKLIGRQFLNNRLPADQQLLVLSGRASFELMQKAARAAIPIVIAIGAPSSLAVKMAHHHGITLIGFARADRFNIYTGHDRVATAATC